MSVVVHIKQNNDNIKKIDLVFVKSFTQKENVFFGVPNEAYVTENYEGDEDLRNKLLVIGSSEKPGRGFSFSVDDSYDVELILNYPAANTDIRLFYGFVYDLCTELNINIILQEGEPYSIDKMDALQNEAIEFNKKVLKTDITEGLTIFGCVYPICLEKSLFSQMNSADADSAAELFENYLIEKQKQDCYYAKPLLYDIGDDKVLARYVLTRNVPSVFPINAHLPFGYNQKLENAVVKWNVALVHDEDYKLLDEVTFDEFKSAADFDSLPVFDEKHIIVTLNDEMLKRAADMREQQARESLISWLSDPAELGCEPAKAELTNSFEDEDGIKCYIFRYKKKLIGKWLLGIVSDSGTFSEMKPYNQCTELEDAKHILDMLKSYWKKAAEDMKD